MKKITRKSDKIKAIVPSFQGIAYCPNCNRGRLKPMKGNEFDLKCWECGEQVPIKSIKFETALGQTDSEGSVIVQSRKWKRGIQGAGTGKEKNPLEQELIGRGFQVIDSDWRDQRL